MRLVRLFSHIRNSLWFVPVICVLAGCVLSFSTIAIDRRADFELIPESLTGDPDAALAILSTIAASMVSLAALVLTITMVVVQLAMGQFSPRIVQTFLRDKPSQLAIGIFVATFAHAMFALREVRSGEEPAVPGLAIVVAYVLVVVSIVALVIYVHHIGQSLQVSALIELVGTRTRRVLDNAYPETAPQPERGTDNVIPAPHSGVVSYVDHKTLIDLAREDDCVLELIPSMGSFVPAGAPLLEIHGARQVLEDDTITKAIVLSQDRQLEHDPAYGFRMLVDIAERSIAESPFLDPTTAVQAIDRLHDGLRQLSCRRFPSGSVRDADGVVRFIEPTMAWDDYVHLAFDEIRLAGAGSPQIHRRLNDALRDLESVVSPARRQVLVEQRGLLRSSGQRAFAEQADVDRADACDRQGIGVASERTLTRKSDGT
jgi:uncharacterized membrane protein